MFQLWRALDQKDQIIRGQRGIILLLLLACGLLWWGWQNAPQNLRIYIPPDLSSGVTLKKDEVPKPFIYSFAFQVWQEINYWPTADISEHHEFAYWNNIHTYWAYLTPSFREKLLQDYSDLKDQGRVERTRGLQGQIGAAFETAWVTQLSPDSWDVTLVVRLSEHAGAMLVKDVDMKYSLLVVKQDISRAANPYGLALAGFIRPPKRLKTYV